MKDLNSTRGSFSSRLLRRQADGMSDTTALLGGLNKQQARNTMWELSRMSRHGNETAATALIVLFVGIIAMAALMPDTAFRGR